MSYTLPLAQLIEVFQKLPGVGPKSAQRIAFHVLKQSQEDVSWFSEVLLRAKSQIGYCETCYNLTNAAQCELCSDERRNRSLICVVAEPRDLYALDKTGEYQGVYHVLGGLISPMDGIGPEGLRVKELIQRLSLPENTGIQEIILALPPSIEGDTTSLYLAKLLKPIGIKLSRIAFGIPVGGDLEYADSLTLVKALEGRRDL